MDSFFQVRHAPRQGGVAVAERPPNGRNVSHGTASRVHQGLRRPGNARLRGQVRKRSEEEEERAPLRGKCRLERRASPRLGVEKHFRSPFIPLKRPSSRRGRTSCERETNNVFPPRPRLPTMPTTSGGNTLAYRCLLLPLPSKSCQQTVLNHTVA